MVPDNFPNRSFFNGTRKSCQPIVSYQSDIFRQHPAEIKILDCPNSGQIACTSTGISSLVWDGENSHHKLSPLLRRRWVNFTIRASVYNVSMGLTYLSKQCRWVIKHSSKITASVILIRSARRLSLGMWHTELPSRRSMGILNMEWAIWPPGKSRHARPVDATQRMMVFWAQTAWHIVW